MGGHHQNVRNATHVLSRFDTILGASERELKKTATWYESVDLEEARKLDAACPKVKTSRGVPRPRPSGATPFKDVHDAVSRLTPPGGSGGWGAGHLAELEFAPVNKMVGTLLDFGSPSVLVNEGLKMAFDFDILGYFSNKLAGDWQSYANCMDAWDCLGNFCADAAANIRHGNEVLGTTWRGNAADAAWKYFDDAALRLESARGSFHALRDHYHDITAAVFSFADIVKGLIAQICDLALQAAVSAAASTAVAASGVGLLGTFVGAAFTADRVVEMVSKYEELVAQYDKLLLALTGTLAGAGITSAQFINELEDFPVVGNSYDNKLV
ncbi:hypothetical protein C1N81_17615 [Streptomyces sp. SGAir0957]